MLKNTSILILLHLFAVSLIGQHSYTPVPLDTDWKFHNGGAYGAESTTYDDTAWRTVHVPHDWSIEDVEGTNSPFDPDAHTQVNGGFTSGGTGWYRKKIEIPESSADKITMLQFDGVYMNATIWVNGSKVGDHPYGYTTFQFDITPYLEFGKKNLIAVRAKNLGENSRWYSGSGIYRHVWLLTKNKTHIKPWGVYITTPQINASEAEVVVRTQIAVGDGHDEKQLKTTLVNAAGREVATTETQIEATDKGTNGIEQQLFISSPMLWSLENTHQYTAVTELSKAGEVLDRQETKFGVRSISFDVQKGFLLNGQAIHLKGGCVHHDNGPLGAKAFDRAEERKLELLKESGYNAIRIAHNPPSQKLLETCDRIGLMVIDEAFDMWNVAKNPEDYHLFFKDWWKADVEQMIIRDRNHPSIILWSIGNEIPERGTPEGVETAQMLGDYIRQLDPTRPVTSAVNGLAPDKDPYFATLDVSGYNYAVGGDHYKEKIYEEDHGRVPSRIMYGAESYPIEAFGSWMDVLEYPYVIGDFVWTAWDYIGEAGIGWMGYPQKSDFYPWNLAYNGDFDICGWKRPQSFYRDALWKQNQLSVFVTSPAPSFPEVNTDLADWSKWHWDDVVDHWNWEGHEGDSLEVAIYSSCTSVELFLNDKSLGKKPTGKSTEFRTTFSVPYTPGVLKAVGYNGKKKVNTVALKTATTPVALMATADRTNILANGQDLSYVTVEVVDKEGIRNFKAEDLVQFSIEGPGEIIAVANANPRSIESYTTDKRRAWRGRCMVIVKASGEAGQVKLKASSGKLKAVELLLTTIPVGNIIESK